MHVPHTYIVMFNYSDWFHINMHSIQGSHFGNSLTDYCRNSTFSAVFSTGKCFKTITLGSDLKVPSPGDTCTCTCML
jgi:hypothetical protein